MKKKLVQSDNNYTAAVEDLLKNLDQYDDERLNQKPPDGGWSPMQVMHHLILSEEMSLRYVEKKMSFESAYPVTGFKETWRSFLLWAFLTLPFKWKAPEKIGGDPEVLPAFSSKQKTFERWRAIRSAWAQLIQNMPDDLARRTVYKHPRAGKIGWTHMVSFFGTHLSRHRKQIMKAL